MSKEILIIDDDIQIGNLEEEVLKKAGYACRRAYSGTEAALLLEKGRPQLVLMDLMLPGLSGEELLPLFAGIPVIAVSAKVAVEDKISLLNGGAVDYITKPFHTGELLARVEAALRRAVAADTGILRFDLLELNTAAHTVKAKETSLSLTKTEYTLLKIFMQNQGQVLAKSTLIERASFESEDCTETSLKTHISHLRAKLRKATGKEYIEAIWGIGFRFGE